MSIVLNWKNEFTKWAPHMRVVIYHGSAEHIKSVRKDALRKPFDVMVFYFIKRRLFFFKITTYGMMSGHVSWLKGNILWRCLVLDEGLINFSFQIF